MRAESLSLSPTYVQSSELLEAPYPHPFYTDSVSGQKF